jgi:hypothetical protein
VDRLEGQVVVHSVSDPNALTQLVGWYRFKSGGGKVVLRGQSNVFTEMLSSGYRVTSVDNLNRRANELVTNVFGKGCVCAGKASQYAHQHECLERVPQKGSADFHENALVASTYRAVVEPLLQHYGVSTRWLDVVDNVWIALWFACHEQVSRDEFAFHFRRSTVQEGPDAKAYIAVLDTGPLTSTHIPGYEINSEVRLVDLRYAVPSVFLRPHAQHGLLVAPRASKVGLVSLLPKVVAYIEVGLADALDWLGSGAMLSTFVLFPPAVMDEGYRRLVDSQPIIPKVLGHLTLFGPGY